eukprot:UN23689
MSFKNGFCGCLGNIPVCLFSYFCPCYVYGKVAESVGEDFLKTAVCTFFPCRPCFHYKVRGAVRAKYGIEGDEKTDCLLHCCLPVCAIAQEANEVQEQGHVPAGTIIMSRD